MLGQMIAPLLPTKRQSFEQPVSAWKNYWRVFIPVRVRGKMVGPGLAYSEKNWPSLEDARAAAGRAIASNPELVTRRMQYLGAFPSHLDPEDVVALADEQSL